MKSVSEIGMYVFSYTTRQWHFKVTEVVNGLSLVITRY